jgi:hypothetical protein
VRSRTERARREPQQPATGSRPAIDLTAGMANFVVRDRRHRSRVRIVRVGLWCTTIAAP